MLRLPVRDGKWGYVDERGKIAIPLQYNSAHEFSEGLAIVWQRDENLREIIDAEGSVQGKLLKARTYSRFSEGLLDFFETEDGVTRGGRGYMDAQARIVIPPTFSSACPFEDGLAVVKINDKHGIIDRQGDWVIQPRFENLRPFGKCEATTPFEQDEQWGFINRAGEVVLDPDTARRC